MKPEEGNAAVGRARDQFPVGMRVLAVDDDPVCLKVLESLLRRCRYHGKDFCAASQSFSFVASTANIYFWFSGVLVLDFSFPGCCRIICF